MICGASQRRSVGRDTLGSARPGAGQARSCPVPDTPLPAAPSSWQIDLFDNADGNDPCQRYVADIVDHSTHYVVGAYPLETKSAAGVLMVVSGSGWQRPWRAAGLVPLLPVARLLAGGDCNAERCSQLTLSPTLAHPLARQLYHTCCREGFPAIIQSDNGSEFCAALIQKFCDMFGIEHRRGAVGRPNVQVGMK